MYHLTMLKISLVLLFLNLMGMVVVLWMVS